MPADWLVALSWISLITGFLCAGAILADIYLRGHRLPMGVMEPVWPVTALYFGPVALWGYLRFGRTTSPRWLDENDLSEPPPRPGWARVAVGVSHCGAGCTLGDIVAEFLVFWFGITIAGSALLAAYVGDYTLAILFGLAFQYFAIVPMRHLAFRQGVKEAAKADFLSLTAFEVGLFTWMALMALVFFPAPDRLFPNSPVFWFVMQIGMIIGFFTAWPMNVWLLRRGIKQSM